MKKKHFIVSWEIYPFSVLVSIGEHQSKVVKIIEKSGYKLDDEEKEKLWMRGIGRTIMLGGGQTIMRLKNTKPDIVAHEISHAVFFLMDKIGIKLSNSSDEAYSYAIQFLTKKINEQMKKNVS